MRYESARFSSSIQIAGQTLDICRANKGHVIEALSIDGVQGVMLTVGAQRRFVPLSNVQWLDPGPAQTDEVRVVEPKAMRAAAAAALARAQRTDSA